MSWEYDVKEHKFISMESTSSMLITQGQVDIRTIPLMSALRTAGLCRGENILSVLPIILPIQENIR